MKAVVWHGRRDVRVDDVPDPTIEQPTDAVVRITSTGLCGSDLHLYEVLAPFMTPGDILGHEPMGVVEAVGAEVTNLMPGDRVVVPFNIACGHCFMCNSGLQSQCETTQVTEHGTGAALFGFTKLYGRVAGAQAEFLRVPMADYGPVKVPNGPPDDRFVYLSDVLPTAWQAVEYCGLEAGGSVAVIGLGPIGTMAARVAIHRGAATVIGIDLVPDRLADATAHGIHALDVGELGDEAVIDVVRELTGGRGPDAVIDAVGMEAHGSVLAGIAQQTTRLLPDRMAEKVMLRAGVDRLAALRLGIEMVRRGGTVSVAGVYGGMTDPLPLMRMFDKQLTMRLGQANVRRWVDDLLPLLLMDEDVLDVDRLATHRLALTEAPDAYAMFQAKDDDARKVVFHP